MRRYGDGGRVIQAKNQGAITFRSVWGNRRIGFKPTTSAPQWFQYDVRDSVIRTDPANTDVVEGPESYGPHGEAEGTLGYDSFGYRSELTNSALVHLRNRDYDPVSGQFTSRDPLDGVNGTPGVANPYQYADNEGLSDSLCKRA
jgi:RHS repeat-associated protein